MRTLTVKRSHKSKLHDNTWTAQPQSCVYLQGTQRLHTGITVPLEKRVQWVRLEEASNTYTV